MNEAALQRIVQKLRGANVPAHTQGEDNQGLGNHKADTESVAASILAESKPDEAARIVDAWQRCFGIILDRERVLRHLAELRQWQSQRMNGNGER